MLELIMSQLEDITNAKSQHQKNIELQQWLLVSMIKPPTSSNDRDWLFIKEKLDYDPC